MTPEEIATLRLMATTGSLVSITGKELSTLLLERDHLAAENKAWREAVASLLNALRFDAHSCIGRRHEYLTIATKICTFAHPLAGCWYACDECAANPPVDLPTSRTEDIRSAPAIRALRALLGRAP